MIVMDWKNFFKFARNVEGHFCEILIWPGVFLQFPIFRGVFL